MQMQTNQLEESVRRFTRDGLSTRQIVRELAKKGIDTSQSTVARTRQRINTGPNPVLKDDPAPQHPGWAKAGTAAVTIALILLALVCVILLAMARSGHASQQIPACIRYAANGTVTGIMPGTGCPPGWQTIIFTAGS